MCCGCAKQAVTGPGWVCSAECADSDWSDPEYDDSAWPPATLVNGPNGVQPWGPIEGIAKDATWVWSTDNWYFTDNVGAAAGAYGGGMDRRRRRARRGRRLDEDEDEEEKREDEEEHREEEEERREDEEEERQEKAEEEAEEKREREEAEAQGKQYQLPTGPTKMFAYAYCRARLPQCSLCDIKAAAHQTVYGQDGRAAPSA